MRPPQQSAPAFFWMESSSAMLTRRRFTHTKPLKERLLEEARNLREEAKLLPYGSLRDAVVKKARQAETAAHRDEWLTSPGLQPPKKNDTPGPS
jgi:hypothetical protein